MHKYHLGLKELDDVVGGIVGGTNIMLVGPPLSRKESILNSVIAGGLRSGEAVILIDTRVPGARALEWLSLPSNAGIGIVDCVTRTLGITVQDTPLIKHTSSPVDLTGVGVRIGQFMDEFQRRDVNNIRLCIDSLSTMLMYSNLPTVFRFMHVFTGRVMMQRNLGVYLVDEGMHDEQTIATLKQLFNAVLQVKVEDDRSYVRAMGLTPFPTPWYEYEVVDHAAVIRGVKDD